MKKILIGIFLAVVLLFVVLAAARNFIVKTAITKGIEALAGLKVEMRKVDIGLLSPVVLIEQLKVYNPDGFKDRLMADIPLVYVDYDLWGFFKGRAHFNKIKIEIDELSVVLNEKGKLNFNSLAMLMPKSGGGKPPEVKIDELYLKIGKVGYKGYLPAVGIRQMEFNPNIEETFKDVTDPSRVAGDILQKILSRIGISGFAEFDIAGQADKIKSSVMETIDKTKEDLKNIFSK
ncbi:MAG: hypothetical protein WC301_00835 [Candidatus Omnitrophota bacterium]|jgi:hypothetical protein